MEQLVQLRQLRSLKLGNAEESKFTKEGFITVMKTLKEMPELDVFEMRLPAVTELKIGNEVLSRQMTIMWETEEHPLWLTTFPTSLRCTSVLLLPSRQQHGRRARSDCACTQTQEAQHSEHQ